MTLLNHMPNLNQKGAIHFLIPILLIAGIIVGVFLITNGNPLKLFSKASSDKIEWVVSDGDSNNCVTVKNGKKVTTCPTIKFKVSLPADSNISVSKPKIEVPPSENGSSEP